MVNRQTFRNARSSAPARHGCIVTGRRGHAAREHLMTPTQTIDSIDTLKSRLKTIWTSGNYDRFARMMETSAVEFLDRLDVSAGARLLDVACGAGQLALIAARRGIDTTGVDIAPNWIDRKSTRLNSSHVKISYAVFC